MIVHSLNEKTLTIGRDASCDIQLKGMGVSRCHAFLECRSECPHIRDNGSTYGLVVNDIPVSEADLHDGDILCIGVQAFFVRLTPGRIGLEPYEQQHGRETLTDMPSLDKNRRITIGRDPSNDVQIDHPLASRFHAYIIMEHSGRTLLVDNKSTNGTFINGKPVRRHELDSNDIIQIASMRLSLVDGTLHTVDDCNRIRIQAREVSVALQGCVIVDRISLSIDPGEFVAILGPSGAGKTTLASALIGTLPLLEGEVEYNGLPLQQYIGSYTSRIGYVAQKNLLYDDLTVSETLYEQSILRLPGDTPRAQRVARIQEVLETLGLEHAAHRRVCRLSGGEAKRLHLGIVLLSSPTIIFLDEPLAGLDSGLVGTCMHIFRDLARKGHTIILTTHTLSQLSCCDRVLFFSGGTIAYDGPPQSMNTSLKVNELAEAYEKARKQTRQRKTVTGKVKKHIARIRSRTGRLRGSAVSKDTNKSARQRVSPFAQTGMLLMRYVRLFVRDVRNCAVVLAQAPLIALLLLGVYTADRYMLPISFYFCVTISAIWLGSVNAVREIASEWDCIGRDVWAGMSTLPYCVSKLIIAGAVALVQALLLHASLGILFSSYGVDPATLLVIIASAGAGAILGLAVSALSPDVRRAISMLPVVLIPQIFFSGILVPFDEMSAAGKMLSHLTISRPAFSLFKRLHFSSAGEMAFSQWFWLCGVCVGLCILLYMGVLYGIHIRKESDAR